MPVAEEAVDLERWAIRLLGCMMWVWRVCTDCSTAIWKSHECPVIIAIAGMEGALASVWQLSGHCCAYQCGIKLLLEGYLPVHA